MLLAPPLAPPLTPPTASPRPFPSFLSLFSFSIILSQSLSLSFSIILSLSLSLSISLYFRLQLRAPRAASVISSPDVIILVSLPYECPHPHKHTLPGLFLQRETKESKKPKGKKMQNHRHNRAKRMRVDMAD